MIVNLIEGWLAAAAAARYHMALGLFYQLYVFHFII